MEPVGLAVGIVGLAGLFSTCLDVIERVDSYRDFGHDLGFLAAQFKTERLRFKQWGRTLGIEHGNLSKDSHPALGDPETIRTATELLSLVQKVYDGGLDDPGLPRPLLPDAKTAGDGFFPGLAHRGASSESKRGKLAWALREKRRVTAQVTEFGLLVHYLYTLVPPEGVNGALVGQDSPNIKETWASELRQALLKLDEESEAATRKDVRAWLGRHSSNDLFDDSKRKRLDGTCDWILDRPVFLDWVHASSTAPRLLWINAPAGFGKTILCARLIEHLSSTLDTPVGHFFLSSNFESRDDPFIAIRIWIDQVMYGNQVVFDLVRDRWLAQNEPTATRQTIMQLLREVVQTVPGCTFILDGLDECTWVEDGRTGSDSVTDFLERLTGAVADTATRIMVVSRNEPRIRRALSEATGFSELRISSKDVRSDIALYSRSIVDRKLSKKDEPTKEGISNTMADHCNGQFLWLNLHEKSLQSWKNKKQLTDAIEKTPPGLEYAYEREWKAIQLFPEHRRTRAFALLRWVAFALRPLSVCEISEAVLIDDREDDLPVDELPDVVDDEYIDSEIMGPCGSLLQLRKTKKSKSQPGLQTVHLTHFSVKQFLLSNLPTQMAPILANEGLRSSNEALQRALIAKLCLQYVNYQRTWNNPAEDEVGSVQRAFKNYAALSWYTHASPAQESDSVLLSLMIALFDARNPNWDAWRKYFEETSPTPMGSGAPDEVPGSPLHYASRLGFPKLAKSLIIDQKYAVDEKAWMGITAFEISCSEGDWNLVTLLLDQGADVMAVDDVGWTPLHAASNRGHLKIVKLLLEKGVDFTLAETNGWTALNLAANEGHDEVVKLLLEKGADLNQVNNAGWTPINEASQKGHTAVVKLLLENGADFDLTNKDGWGPIDEAVARGHAEVVRLLLEHGADLEAARVNGWTALIMACFAGSPEVIKLLLEKGADVNKGSDLGYTPLSMASSQGHIEMVKLLLDSGAELNPTKKNVWTAVDMAAYDGQVEVMKLLLEKGADFNYQRPEGWTPVNTAAYKGQAEVAEILIKKGADISIPTDMGWTPLITAASQGHFEVVKLVIENGAGLDVVDNKGWTALNAAAVNGHVEIIKLLLEKGADFELADNNQWTPLNAASYKGSVEAVELLLEKGSDLKTTTSEGWTPLFSASRNGHTDVARLLLEKGADLNTTDKHGWTCLNMAADEGHVEVAKLFLEKGVDVNQASSENWTPLYSASRNGHTEMVNLLLEKGADLTIRNIHGWTCINTTASGGHIEVVRLLIKKGADLNLGGNDGCTPVYSASRFGHTEVVKLLLDNGADLHIASTNGLTPLYSAAKNGRAEVAKLLLEKGADVNAASNQGWTPLFSASWQGHTEVVKVLLDNGANFTDKINVGSADKSVESPELLTPLEVATQKGHAEVVKLLEGKQADVGPPDQVDHTIQF